ncbi:MAG: hypothetical protein V3S10_04160 [Dehalococcoidales bacterium]
MEKALSPVKPGDEIPVLVKTAYMPIDPNTRNVIHTDDYARDFGMRGALIGGSTLLSYLLEMLYGYFGDSWYSHGGIKVSYVGGGAINGDVLTAHGRVKAVEPEEAGDRLRLDVWLENQVGNRVAVGEASCIQLRPVAP